MTKNEALKIGEPKKKMLNFFKWACRQGFAKVKKKEKKR